jgi:hypothetical protein
MSARTRLRQVRRAVHDEDRPPPRVVRRELRHDPRLAPRRAIIGLSLAAAGAMGVVALYQTGVLRRLPLARAGTEGSSRAYRFAMPEGMIALRDHAVTALLAAAGSSERAENRPWLPLLMFAKLGYDVYRSAERSRRQWQRYGEVSPWTLVAATSAFAALPLAFPEAGEGLQNLVRRLGRALA